MSPAEQKRQTAVAALWWIGLVIFNSAVGNELIAAISIVMAAVMFTLADRIKVPRARGWDFGGPPVHFNCRCIVVRIEE